MAGGIEISNAGDFFSNIVWFDLFRTLLYFHLLFLNSEYYKKNMVSKILLDKIY